MRLSGLSIGSDDFAEAEEPYDPSSTEEAIFCLTPSKLFMVRFVKLDKKTINPTVLHKKKTVRHLESSLPFW